MFEVCTTSFKQQYQPPVALFQKSFAALSINPCGNVEHGEPWYVGPGSEPQKSPLNPAVPHTAAQSQS